MEGDGGGWETFGGRCQDNVAAGGGSAEDGEGVAFVELSVCGPEGIVVKEISVVYGDDVGWTSDGEVDAGFAVGNNGAITIYECGGGIADVVPIGCRRVRS